MKRKQVVADVLEKEIKRTKARLIESLEIQANMESISIPERLAKIHLIYQLRGIPKYVYSEGGVN